jgi:formylglycine-generating enzyme required for sulfatase activity
MLGNVLEWVEDCYQDNYAGAPADGATITSENCNRRVVRGGSFTDPPKFLRSAYRFFAPWENRGVQTGFRIGRTLVQ